MPGLLLSTRRLLAITASATGEQYYRQLARGVAECLGVKFGLVGHLVGAKMRLRAIWQADPMQSEETPGRFLPGFDYDLEGTPCQQVLERGFCHFPEGAATLFPNDPMLLEMGIESYLGFRISSRPDPRGGIVIALHDRPTAHIPEELEVVLEVMAQRAGAEFEHERIAIALHATEARYRGVVEDCLEGVWILDKDNRTSFVNTQMAQMLGYSCVEMLGRPLFDFMDDAAVQQAKAHVDRRRSGIRERHEFRLRRKDGSEQWTIMATAPIVDDSGAYAGAQALVTDLTERRQLEARVLQAQKLESLGVLAGGIAHDFNNLLVGILGNTGLALLNVPEESPVRPALHDIQATTLRLADLTRQMLAYSGGGRFVIERLNLNRLIEEIAHLLSTVISKKAVLRFNLSATPMEIEGDATQLRQIVMNLITNASDALGDEEGVITISTSHVHVTREYLDSTFINEQLSEGAYTVLEVADTGIGMDTATREKVFDPFFTTKFTGRGLGLAAVLGILRGHRGAVKVYSEVGKGSVFRVLLPQVPPLANNAQVNEAPVATVGGSGVVLVADDEPGVRRIATRLLEKAGYEVLVAADGRAAVDIIDREGDRISVVLLDMTMPVLSGEEVFTHIRRAHPAIRVVLSSGYNEPSSHFTGKGLAAFLHKPWTPADLYAAVQLARDT